MFIKSIVIDGFKSYGTRTEISGFDREFNAITGLNGSGKSNILDAICFLLGIQVLGQVRAHTLLDLVYKQGHTGVTKASVTITFDNTDKSQSPINFEKHNEIVITRQVVLGGKNKYIVNGANASNVTVKDLFCSVQLNVNNAHFLVMQGRITKVLNMKPMEILSMIEEACGTGMFEAKKIKAERELKNKEQRRQEINYSLDNELQPELDKLRHDYGQYQQFKQIERELMHSRKVHVAWRYYSSKQNSEQGTEKAAEIIQGINKKREANEESQQQIQVIEKQVVQLQQQIDKDSGGSLAQADNQYKTAQTQYNHYVGAQKQNQENIEDEKKRIIELEQSVKEDEKVIKVKSAALDKIDGTFQRLAEQEENDKKQLDAARNKYQAISAGMEVDEEGNEGTLQDRLMAAQRDLSDAKLQMETIKRKKPHAEADLAAKTKEMAMLNAELCKDNAARNQLEQQMAGLRNQLEAFDALKEEERSVNMEASKLRRQRDSYEQRDGRLSFRYQDPEPGFSRKSVHGLVCRLIEVDDPSFCQAIEKTAGGRLFNVVVDTDITSRKLLNNGKLERRTTIIPLNKISGRRLSGRVIEAAKRIAGANNVWPALSLIQYSDILAPAMEYIFGTTLICRDIATAKKVCYNREVNARCVTLDGDVCDPSGTLSGGAAERTQPILPMLQELRAVLQQLDGKDMRLAEIDRELKQITTNPQALKAKHDQLENDLFSVAARLQQSDQVKKEVETLQAQVNEFAQCFAECEEMIKKQTKTISEVQSKMGKSNRDSMLKTAEADVKKLTAKATQSRKEVLKRKDEYEALKLELNELETQITLHKDQIEKHKRNIASLENDRVELIQKVNDAKNTMEEFRSEQKSVKDFISKKSKEVQKMQQESEKLRKQITTYELEIKQAQKDHDRWKQNSKDSKQRVAELYKEHDWIAEEEQFFNKPNGSYDFSKLDPDEVGKRVAQLTERKNKLEKTLNTKAMELLRKTEEEFKKLFEKREQVDRDKENIEKVIENLSERKKEALITAFKQVNKDFGSIFSSLLPGGQAELKPVDKDDVLKGFQFRVGFTKGKWKESLAELSGGQRSLVALSLILAMLLFKPAPLYILDEVDAALDLSHTNNIGNMLKTHFKASQFIVVSLKDGMFNNANVLFRTKFVNGMSTVTRTNNINSSG